MLKSTLPVSKTFKTGNKPVLVSCEDGFDYVVKSNQGKRPPFKIIKEFLVSYFAFEWDIPTPVPKLINIQPEHLKSRFFEGNAEHYSIPCFGSRYSAASLDWDDLVLYWTKDSINRISNSADLLKILLFDLWLANEDRFYKNHNLLILNINNEFVIHVIDHEGVFNASNFHHNVIYWESNLQLPSDNLFGSESVVRVLLSVDSLENQIVQLKPVFHDSIARCKSNLTEIISRMPEEWQIDKLLLESYAHKALFDSEWLNLVFDYFIREAQKKLFFS